MVTGALAAIFVVVVMVAIFWATTRISRVRLDQKLGAIPRFDINDDWYCAVAEQEFVLVQKLNEKEAGRILRTHVHNIFVDPDSANDKRVVVTLEWTKSNGDKRTLDFYFEGNDPEVRAQEVMRQFRTHMITIGAR